MTASKMNRAEALDAPFLAAVFASALGRMRQVSAWWRNRRAYLHLMSLDDHLLKDIGISRSEIYGAVNMTSERASARKRP